MAPTPKRKHSTRRTGKRRAARKFSLPEIVYDAQTGLPRLSHRKPAVVLPKESATS